jgi:demethylmenaquinone methyltransferase / 2-methoxy-6-polyprenyl-1,4-benzoquinol methylase
MMRPIDLGRPPAEGGLPDPGEGTRTGSPVPAADVASMFDEIAPVYDRLNTMMTLGFDGRWRRAAARVSGIRSGDAAIDVACGTGKLAADLAGLVGPFGRVLGVDLSPAMIDRARTLHRDLVQLDFEIGDALGLQVEDASFDAATIAFGLRNLTDFEAGFRELGRVVRPGGRVVCLELTNPRPRWWARIYRATFSRMAPVLGSFFGRRVAYRYLPRSLEGFPDAERLAMTMRLAGLASVRYRRLGLGGVALHVGEVPPRSPELSPQPAPR